ncbi:MAG: ubiquinol-cytochrome c reductase iron-sulfur subunit [Gammaproteobacteria bacterium]|nr:ubiquinol-cytochrome c reductase iron-sulfur subunit [Gammaproteobacteria bacterium]NIN62833.1 ubiquinol-cytochrome c reductase iron-sulfur subunit [Gammaproteobacteria bacterium]NIO63814.1 ubiquinol-cytochrome c reductase iron-sulfur subunit [Gammaproteobacteria bacterium]NIP50192.1 ubiquinol-cytochrome c reductase iron-sulfur subunit [Gammaproteobacteria bacterium]NIQ12410.1 ubiquinol-cytochrome c reductase iron-sulfur subunit [Gammaproteobacteria bacterium]
MQDGAVDKHRRRFLTTTATVVGGAGVIASSIPFISALKPSEKTKAIGAPVEVDISEMKPGEKLVIEWQGKPVWILKRDQKTLNDLELLDEKLRDPDSEQPQQPDYAENQYRSIRPEYLVVVGLCTHLGCSPNYFPINANAGLGDDWKGGFFCPCHGSRFDLAGRVFKGVPAPTNLVIPPYKYLSDSRILIGDDSGEIA